MSRRPGRSDHEAGIAKSEKDLALVYLGDIDGVLEQIDAAIDEVLDFMVGTGNEGSDDLMKAVMSMAGARVCLRNEMESGEQRAAATGGAQ